MTVGWAGGQAASPGWSRTTGERFLGGGGSGGKKKRTGCTTPKTPFEASRYIRIYSYGKYRKVNKQGVGARIQEKQKLYKKVNNNITLLGLVVNNIYTIIMI